MPDGEKKKESGNWLGYLASGVGGFVLGFAGGWVANDMAREAELAAANPQAATAGK